MSRHKKSTDNSITIPAPPPFRDDVRAKGFQGEAVFLGWQKPETGDIFPLYNIMKMGHPSYLSTVTDKTLHALHLRIPRTPSPYPDLGSSPWHGMSTELVDAITAREAIEAAGLNYTVVKKPLKDVMELMHPADVSDRWATVRTDTGDVLGIVGDSYEPIQNVDAFTFFDALVGTDEAMYETAGVIGRGERIWILAKLPGYIKVQGKDIVGKYLLLTNSHDGSSPVRVKLTPIRVVCNNTLTAALKGEGEVNIRHTTNAAGDAKQALSLLGLSNSLYETLDAVFNRMALTKITDKQLGDYLKALVPDDEKKDSNARVEAIRNTCLGLYENGRGAEFSRGTLWGAFNCITEYAGHKMETGSVGPLESLWFGGGEQLTKKAFRLAEHMM